MTREASIHPYMNTSCKQSSIKNHSQRDVQKQKARKTTKNELIHLSLFLSSRSSLSFLSLFLLLPLDLVRAAVVALHYHMLIVLLFDEVLVPSLKTTVQIAITGSGTEKRGERGR